MTVTQRIPTGHDPDATPGRVPPFAGLNLLDADHPWLSDALAARRAFARILDERLPDRATRLRRLWAYYANPMTRPTARAAAAERPYRVAQEWGLPARLTGSLAETEPLVDAGLAEYARKQVVVENDIGWRIDAGIDALFGRPVVVESAAGDPARSAAVTDLLNRILTRNGGMGLLQRAALLGAIYGAVDLLISVRAAGDDPAAGVTVRTAEPTRSLAVVDPLDAERLVAFVQVWQPDDDGQDGGPAVPSRHAWLGRLARRIAGGTADPAGLSTDPRAHVLVTGRGRWVRFVGGRRIDAGVMPEGMLPVVHVQNLPRPFAWDGAGDVEPLVPLQDELNTRLSDRASRVTLASAKMYLGVGIDGFESREVQPGRMWATDNPDARVTEFGGDADVAGEERAIRDVREALDKASGVNPTSAGVVRNRVGHLTSAAALRLTFASLIARTERKRLTYGDGLARALRLVLDWLDATGRFPTRPDEREIRLRWSDVIPTTAGERLEQAALKRRIGVDRARVLQELGY